MSKLKKEHDENTIIEGSGKRKEDDENDNDKASDKSEEVEG